MTLLHLDIRRTLRDLTLTVDREIPLDGITAVFGPSGSGKTTLLRAIAGLDRDVGGTVRYADETWQDDSKRLFIPAHRRGVGFVFQDARLFSHLNVTANLRYAERRSRRARRGIEFDDVVDALDLGALLDRQTTDLSGGERQRVAIGRTLLARPQLLLMDEPLAALDMRRKAAILPYVETLPERFGVPVLYVTHAIAEVAQISQTMVLLSDGQVTAHGPVSELMERLDLYPMTGRFEAGVVLAARVAGHDEAYRLSDLTVAGQSVVVPIVDLPVGADLRVRIRARDVALATEKPGGISIRNVLAGTIAEIAEEPDTAFAEVLVDIGDGQHLRARLTRRAVADLTLAPGRHVFGLVKSVAIDRRMIAPGAGPRPRADRRA
ncbi:MAG: molybdenum ABC transporter ATP-binding protein [Pseudomonadota bacterium]